MLLAVLRFLRRVADNALNAFNLRPIDYAWLLPASEAMTVAKLDRLASTGDFPSLTGLSDSLVYCLLLGVTRFVLQHLLLKVTDAPLCISTSLLNFRTDSQWHSASFD